MLDGVIQLILESRVAPNRLTQLVYQTVRCRQCAVGGGIVLLGQCEECTAIVIGADDDDEFGGVSLTFYVLPRAGIHSPATLVIDMWAKDGTGLRRWTIDC